MPETPALAKAELRELDANYQNEINDTKWAKVQFNPENLKVSFANQVATPSGSGDQKGSPSRQFVGAGTTKLTLQIWFDVGTLPDELRTVDGKAVQDVRQLTGRIAYFITPQPDQADASKFVPPAVRFVWGSFQFDGIMDSLEESLEFFSNEGRPLRASMSLSLSQQKITKFAFRDTASPPGSAGTPGGGRPGTRPLAQAPAGSNLQSMAASQGKAGQWQAIASANGIENPRILSPGQLIDMNVSVSGGASVGASAGVSGGVTGGASLGGSTNLGR